MDGDEREASNHAKYLARKAARKASTTVTHNQHWSSAGYVFVTIENGNALAAAEKPATAVVWTITADSFVIGVDLFANAAVQRAVTVGYLCLGIV